MARFQSVSVDDVENFMNEHENINTKRKTQSHLRLLAAFLTGECGETREVREIPPNELDCHLSKFFLSVRTPKGTEYEPTSLRSMLGSFERYLKRHTYGWSVITSVEFAKTRSAMKAKQKDLKSQGKGNKPMKAQPLTDADIDKLYESGQLGIDNPSSMINTLWFNNTLYFGMRGGISEHRSLAWGDVTLHVDEEGGNLEYLEYNERITKTRPGDNTTNTRSCPPRMYATPDCPDRCPVNAYKSYTYHRKNMTAVDEPFYLSVVTHNRHPSPTEQWFLHAPMGVNKLSSLMTNMATAADLPPNKRVTNTSVRKTLVQKMTDRNVPDNLQVYVTGHKNPASLNNYRDINDRHKLAISRVLSAPRLNPAASTAPNPECVSYPNWLGERSVVPSTTNTASHSQQTHSMESLFAGSTISGGNITVNINYNSYSVPTKRRRVIMSDTDSD